jgi:death on curing protein
MAKTSSRRHLESALSEAERSLDAVRAELADAQQANKDLAARTRELEEELDRRLPHADGEDGSDVTERDEALRDALSREWQLARRVAELEASRSMEPPPSAPDEELRALTERLDTLSLQLDAARAREDELAVRAVRAERTLAETGSRLATLGERADEAEGLEAALADLRDASEHAAKEAAQREDEIRARLDEALIRATALEADLKESRADAERAAEAIEDASARATVAEDRLKETGLELAAATEVLRHLEEVFAAVRERVDHPREDPGAPSDGSPIVDDPSAAGGGPDRPATNVRPLEIEDVIAIAEAEYGPGAPVDLAALGEALGAPSALDEHGDPLFPGLHVKAALLFVELIRRRPYLQGNRRIALLATVRFLDLNAVDVVGGDEALSELALAIEAGEVPLLSIAATLEALTVARGTGPDSPMQDVG